MILAAARRFAIIAVAAGLAGVLLGAVISLAADSPFRRGVALGLYSVGALCIVIGIGVAFRNSLERRFRGGAEIDASEPAAVDPELAGVLIALGLLLLVTGIGVDSRVSLI